MADSLRWTTHARERAARRKIDEAAVALAVRFGRRMPEVTCTRYYVTPYIARQVPGLQRWERLEVVASLDGVIVTVYRWKHATRRW
jgi:hypothetical protein